MQDRSDQEPNVDVKKEAEHLDKFFERKKMQMMINEFFTVQRNFHAKMDNLMQVCRHVSGQLTEEQQSLLEKMLGPFGVLIANPFAEKPSGDLMQDLAHIMGVVNARNEHFSKTLPALMLSASSLYDFNELLATIRKDKKLADMFLEGLQSKSWLDVESHVAQPHQNLVRYELLLRAIEKVLKKETPDDMEPLLGHVADAIAFIMPELSFFNEHRVFLTQLNEVDALLLQLEGVEAYKVEAVRRFIAGARHSIARGTADILDVMQGLCVLLREVHHDAAVLYKQARSTYKAQAYYGVLGLTETFFGEDVVFAKQQRHPSEKLLTIIQDLERNHEQAEFIRGKEQAATNVKFNL